MYTVRIIIAKSPQVYRCVTALFEILVKNGKDFLTKSLFGQKHAILEKSTIVQSMVNSSF